MQRLTATPAMAKPAGMHRFAFAGRLQWMVAPERNLFALVICAMLALGGCGDRGGSSVAPPPDPNAPGPFAVGVQSMTFTRTSSTTGAPRPLDTVIWYPAPAGTTGQSSSGGILNAPLAGGAPFPLIMFSHGSCGFPAQSVFLTAQLASLGFIVAAPPHPGNTFFDGIVQCQTSQELTDSFINRVPDIDFVLEQLVALSASSGDPLSGAIDVERIGMSGHSFGGQTALRVAAENQRMKAVLALAPAAVGIVSVTGEISIPAMIQDGNLDSLTPVAQNAVPLFAALHPPRYFAEFLDTGHFAFADVCPTPAEFGGADFPECHPGTLSQDQAHALVLRFAVPFLERYVARDHRFDSLLDPANAPAGVEFTADAG